MENPIIQIQQGQLRGVVETNVYGTQFVAFRGIPYAKPPVGELRFKDPEPVEPWSGIRDATEFGNQCAQKDWVQKKTVGDEDCLFLNVYTSDLKSAAPRAVMVWIHGGAFAFGSGDDQMYGPDYLIEKDIVLVTINYRLGVLGFLNLDDEAAPGNQGLKDQVLALKWVQQNITRFGGDPHNVTIFGESAGGASVHYLTVSPLAQGLFHKAIMQSGVITNPWASSAYSTKESAQKMSSILGNEITDAKKLVEFLRTVDIDKLIDAEYSLNTWQNSFKVIFPFGPTVDSKSKNSFLSLPIQEAAKSGIKVPCMLGYLTYETLFRVGVYTDDNFSEIDANQEHLLVHPAIKKLLDERNIGVNDIKELFMGDDKIDRKNIQKLIVLHGTLNGNIGIHQVVEIQTQIPHIPTYLFKFEYEYEDAMMQKIMDVEFKGACHGEDIKFLFNPKLCKMFGQEPPAPGSTEYLITQRFVELWTNFAKTGHPTPHTSELIPIDWKPVDNPLEYNCLRISEDLSMIKEPNILFEIEKKVKENRNLINF